MKHFFKEFGALFCALILAIAAIVLNIFINGAETIIVAGSSILIVLAMTYTISDRDYDEYSIKSCNDDNICSLLTAVFALLTLIIGLTGSVLWPGLIICIPFLIYRYMLSEVLNNPLEAKNIKKLLKQADYKVYLFYKTYIMIFALAGLSFFGGKFIGHLDKEYAKQKSEQAVIEQEEKNLLEKKYVVRVEKIFSEVINGNSVFYFVTDNEMKADTLTFYSGSGAVFVKEGDKISYSLNRANKPQALVILNQKDD